MTSTRKIVRFAMLSLGVILLVGVVSWWRFVHEFRFNISQTDMEPVETMLKKALSDAVVVKHPGSEPGSVSAGYISVKDELGEDHLSIFVHPRGGATGAERVGGSVQRGRRGVVCAGTDVEGVVVRVCAGNYECGNK
jgi:hypothetical protein